MNRQQELANEWYEFFMTYSPHFRTLSMDMQGEIVVDQVKYQMENEND